MNEDWGHLGIHSPLTVRRIDVAMQEYRIRFERKQVRRVSCKIISPVRCRSDLFTVEGAAVLSAVAKSKNAMPKNATTEIQTLSDYKSAVVVVFPSVCRKETMSSLIDRLFLSRVLTRPVLLVPLPLPWLQVSSLLLSLLPLPSFCCHTLCFLGFSSVVPFVCTGPIHC